MGSFIKRTCFFLATAFGSGPFDYWCRFGHGFLFFIFFIVRAEAKILIEGVNIF
jgi:hypothetical protein